MMRDSSVRRLGCASALVALLLVLAFSRPAAAETHAACSRCGKWYKVSDTGFGFLRNHVGLCGTCRAADNSRDGRGEGEQGAPGNPSAAGENMPQGANTGAAAQNARSSQSIANEVSQMLDSLNSGSAGSTQAGSNVPRNAATAAPPPLSAQQLQQIANDVDQLLDTLNAGVNPGESRGNNSGRYENTKR